MSTKDIDQAMNRLKLEVVPVEDELLDLERDLQSVGAMGRVSDGDITASALAAARLVRTMRSSAGFTQEQLAERSGLTQPALSDIERGVGRRGPNFETLLKVASACGFRIDATADKGSLLAANAQMDLCNNLRVSALPTVRGWARKETDAPRLSEMPKLLSTLVATLEASCTSAAQSIEKLEQLVETRIESLVEAKCREILHRYANPFSKDAGPTCASVLAQQRSPQGRTATFEIDPRSGKVEPGYSEGVWYGKATPQTPPKPFFRPPDFVVPHLPKRSE